MSKLPSRISLSNLAMMAVLTILPFFGGCSFVRDLARPFLPKSDSVKVVPPSFSLHGRAAHAQDSLHAQLEWIASQPLPKGLSLQRLAFRNRPDSTVDLLATVEDDRRLNSHGLDRAGIRAREAERIGKESPLLICTRSTGIDHRLVIRSVFTHRDYMFQNAKAVQDTVDVVLSDGKSLPPPD